ncbi:MAG: transcription antitermination factor NusB [Sedimentisphaerales bacterium]|nr:transcription antitermination factor NusB [Sedimentisphaerales bacterium]
MKTDKRTRARELAIQALYQLDVQGTVLLEHLQDFLLENENDSFVRRLAADWSRGTWDNLKACDQLIADSVIRWNFSRLAPVDKSILRLACYQLSFCPDIPPNVVINEAIELAKKFSTTQSPAFVNGVLDAILKKLKSG